MFYAYSDSIFLADTVGMEKTFMFSVVYRKCPINRFGLLCKIKCILNLVVYVCRKTNVKNNIFQNVNFFINKMMFLAF